MVTCKKCGKEFKTDTSLKEHLRDARVHRESTYQHKSAYRKWILAIFVLVILAIFAYRATTERGSANGELRSNIVLNNVSVNVTADGGWIKASLNPLDKTNYATKGSVQLINCPSSDTMALCPNLEMWVMNDTGFSNFQQGGLATAPYEKLEVTTALGTKSNFTLHGLNYNGSYYFEFIVLQQGTPLNRGTHATVSISLVETWVEK